MKDNAVKSGIGYGDSKMTLIVRCTSCNTKFAVNKVQLGESSIPKFHCSRCDNVFTVNLNENQDPNIEDDRSQFSFEFNDNNDTVTLSKLHDPAESTFVEDESKMELSTPKFSGSVMTEDAYEPIADSDLEPEFFTGLLGHSHDNIDTTSQMQTAMAIPQLEEPMGYESLRTIKMNSQQNYAEQTAKKQESIMQNLRMPSSSKVLLIGLLALLALPILAYQWIVASPSSADPLFLQLNGSTIKLPPDELFIRSSFIKRIHLDTGEPVSVMSGVIKNNSEYNLKQITIEGILYSSQGAVLKRKNIDISASLGRSRIQSLSLDMLDDLQSNSSAKNFMLRPSQESEFTLVIPEGDNTKDTHFYATRIYSVEY